MPWMFTCVPSDNLQAPVLSEAIARAGKPFAMLTATDHDSRAFAARLDSAFVGSRIDPKVHVEFEAGTNDLPQLSQRVLDFGVSRYLLIAGPRDRVCTSCDTQPWVCGRHLCRTFSKPECRFWQTRGLPPRESSFLSWWGTCRSFCRFAMRSGSASAQNPTGPPHTPGTAPTSSWAGDWTGGPQSRACTRCYAGAVAHCPGNGLVHWDDHGQNDRRVRLGVIRSGKLAVVAGFVPEVK